MPALTRSLTFALVIISALVLTACKTAPKDGDSGKLENNENRPIPVAILASASNAQGGTLTVENTVLMDKAQAADYAIDLTSLTDAVEGDTAAYLVATLGEKPSGGYSITIDSAEAIGDVLLVKATAISPGPDTIVTQALTQPWAAIAIERAPYSKVRFLITAKTE